MSTILTRGILWRRSLHWSAKSTTALLPLAVAVPLCVLSLAPSLSLALEATHTAQLRLRKWLWVRLRSSKLSYCCCSCYCCHLKSNQNIWSYLRNLRSLSCVSCFEFEFLTCRSFVFVSFSQFFFSYADGGKIYCKLSFCDISTKSGHSATSFCCCCRWFAVLWFLYCVFFALSNDIAALEG